jgi:adenylate cyclase
LKKIKSLLLLLTAILIIGCKNNNTTEVKNGVLNVEQWDFKKNGTITLNGEWEFYWNQLLEPNNFQDSKVKTYIELPTVWNNYVFKNQKLDGAGFATFRLRIKNDFKNQRLGLRIPFHFTAYKLWVNKNLVALNGVVGKTKETSKPQTLPMYVYFDSPDADILLTLQVSNYYYNKGGAPAPYKFGLESQIKAARTKQLALELVLIGSLFIMAIHHFGLFLLRTKEKSALIFSLICFFVMLRTICLGETILIEIYPDFDFEIYSKLIFISAFTSPALFAAFLDRLYPDESIPLIRKGFFVSCAILTSTLFFPATVSTAFLEPMSLLVLCSLTYSIFVLTKALIHKREGAIFAFVGMLVLLITAVNDVLFDNQIISSDYYVQYGLLFFIFSQSFLLSLKSSLAFLSIENLSIRINKINIASSRFVPSEFLSSLGKESVIDVNLGDHVIKDMTILFADIRSFTTISESMTPEENFEFINKLLKRISPIIRANNGFIDKFIGDSIMALFPGNPKDAVLAASHLLKELDDFNTERNLLGLSAVRIGIGINSGSSMLGTIGEELRMDGTVISDAVNLASRIESLTKVYGANVMVSSNVLDAVKDILPIDFRFLGNVQVKGKIHFVDIYDIFSFDSYEVRTLKFQTMEQFEKAINLFQDKSIEEAKIIFESILEIFPEDKATQFYLHRIKNEF